MRRSVVRTLIVVLTAVSPHHASAQCVATEWESFASDGQPDDLYAETVAVGGDWMMVGAPLDDDNGVGAGAVYVYRRSSAGWTQTQKLLANDASPAGDGFGVWIDISGDSAIISAILDDEGATDAGASYIFVQNGGQWTQEDKLIDVDAEEGDQAGMTVAIDGDTAVVGADEASNENGMRAGEAYVFVRNGTTWTQQVRLTALTEDGQPDGAPDDLFGKVGISGDTIIVGADQDDDFGTKSGSAYVFVRTGIVWDMVKKLNPTDADAGDEFSNRISVSGDRVLIGANTDDNPNGVDAGSAYIFHFNGSSWVEEDKLLASDGSDSDGNEFGSGLALFGDLAVVGAKRHTVPGSPSQSGQAYVFRRFGMTWVEQARLRPSDATLDGHFGFTVDISSDAIAVGTLFSSDFSEPQSGLAYVWGGLDDCNANGLLDLCDVAGGGDADGNGIPDECECPADITGAAPGSPPDGVVNVFDLLLLLEQLGTPGPEGDITGPNPGDPPDGVVNIFDLLALLAVFGQTCQARSCPADLTGPNPGDPPDGTVDVFDLLLLLANFGTPGPVGDITGPNPGDPPDGAVNVFDLLALLAVFGQTCPTP